MMDVIYVALGGAAGSIVRFQAGKALNERYARYVPVGTFLVNITGAFLLGLVTTSVKSKSWQLLVADGFLGAYTTFSTFLYEGYMLYQAGEKKRMALYLAGSLAAGVLGFGLGALLGTLLPASG
jgi:fluoride exporter